MTESRYRGSLVVWALLIAYASLYPFFPLRPPSGEAVATFFSKPRYLTGADIALNVLAYVPLGTLATLFFRQARGNARSIGSAVALAVGLSLSLETIQLFIPNRVAQVFDVLANGAGALLGALVFVDPVYSMATRPLGELRERWIIPGAWGDAGLVLTMLWLLAQLNPALPFFGAGNIGGDGLEQLEVLQWTAVGLGICGFGLFVSTLMREGAGSLRVTLVLLSLALWLKFATASIILQPHFSEDWLSMGRIAGLAGGIVAFVPLRRTETLARIYLALILVLAGALFSKIFGAYSGLEEFLRLFRWPHGQLATFATLTRFLHEIWPFAAVIFLVSRFVRVGRSPGGRMFP
jgi:VanZ family protein